MTTSQREGLVMMLVGILFAVVWTGTGDEMDFAEWLSKSLHVAVPVIFGAAKLIHDK